MNDTLIVSMLKRGKDFKHQLQSIVDGELKLIAVIRDRDSVDQLHYEIRSA